MTHNSKTGRSARPASGTRRYIAWRIAYIFIAIALLSPSAHARYVQQGPKLVGTTTTGAPQQGIVVAISGDGNTAIVGAPGDGVGVGAAFIFARNNGLWVQQAKFVGTNTPGNTRPEQRRWRRPPPSR